ncbi:hypothetical protein Plhal304r1_c034g0106911 [Plasmopara halstedii]
MYSIIFSYPFYLSARCLLLLLLDTMAESHSVATLRGLMFDFATKCNRDDVGKHVELTILPHYDRSYFVEV